MLKRTSALNFASVQISNVKHNTELSVIYHDHMDIMEQAMPGIDNFFDEHFHLLVMKLFGRSWPVLGVAMTASH